MKRLPVLFFVILALGIAVSCKKEGEDLDHQSARLAAQKYMQMLCDSNYSGYVDGMLSMQNADSSMRQQMEDAINQYYWQIQQSHGGIVSATATRDTIIDSLARVFVNVTFADSVSEEILLPLVYSEGKWWL